MAIPITKDFELPSRGRLYGKDIKWKNQLRSPRLCDRGFGDIIQKNKLQASILDKTIVEPLGMSTYDLHPADFIYLNFIQRQLLKGAAPYKISVICKSCGKKHDLDIDVTDIKILPLKESGLSPMVVKVDDETEVTVTYATPRILDDIKAGVELFKEEYPNADGDIETQEYLRKVITHVNGARLTYTQATTFIQNLFLSAVEEIINASTTYEWGVQLLRKHRCDACGKMIAFNLPV
jgi:hypothetical protein